VLAWISCGLFATMVGHQTEQTCRPICCRGYHDDDDEFDDDESNPPIIRGEDEGLDNNHHLLEGHVVLEKTIVGRKNLSLFEPNHYCSYIRGYHGMEYQV
jgi:hypothetical protein